MAISTMVGDITETKEEHLRLSLSLTKCSDLASTPAGAQRVPTAARSPTIKDSSGGLMFTRPAMVVTVDSYQALGLVARRV